MKTAFRFRFFWIMVFAILAGCAGSPTTPAPVSQPSPAVSTDTPGPTLTAAAATPTEPAATPTVNEVEPLTVHLGNPWSDFSLRFESDEWATAAFDQNRPGMEMLVHQTLTGCRIIPNIPVGLSNEWTFDTEKHTLGPHQLLTNRFSHNGQLKFAAYYGFLAQPNKGAVEVHFESEPEKCIDAAEVLISLSEVLPGETGTQGVSALVVNEEPGPYYETILQIPVSDAGINYRGAGVIEMQPTVPSALAVLPDGSFMIGDPTANRLVHYTASGERLPDIDLGALGIANVSDLMASAKELYLLEISFNVAPLRFRVNRISFDGQVLAQYDIPEGYRWDDGLYGFGPVDDEGEIILEYYGEVFRYFQLADQNGISNTEMNSLGVYGHLYKVLYGSNREPMSNPAVVVDGLRYETKSTLGGHLEILAILPDSSLFVYRTDVVSDYPVMQSDITVHYLSASGQQLGVARYPIAEWYSFIQRHVAVGPDGNVYALLPREKTVDVLRLNFYSSIAPLIPEAAELEITSIDK